MFKNELVGLELESGESMSFLNFKEPTSFILL